MKIFGRRSIFALVILWAIIFPAGCGKIEEPEFRGIDHVRMSKLGLRESSLTLDLYYYNPNKSGLRMKKAEGDVWIDDRHLGEFEVDTLVRIAPLSEFRIPVKLKVDVDAMVGSSLLALLGKKMRLRIDGKAKIGKAGVYIKQPFHYEGVHDLNEIIK
jgi:LEA14-like dessication related protein